MGAAGANSRQRNNLMTCLGKDCSEKIPLRSRSAPWPRLRQSPDEARNCPTSGSRGGEPGQPGGLGGSRSSERRGGLGDGGALQPVPAPLRAQGCGNVELACQGREPRAGLCVAFWVIHPFTSPTSQGFKNPSFASRRFWFFHQCLLAAFQAPALPSGRLMNHIYAS